MATVTAKTGEVVLLDDGDFDRLPGRVSMRKGYAQITDPRTGRSMDLHRWIMGCTVGDGKIVDHINRDRLDNRRSNLRFVTRQENVENSDRFGPLRGAYRNANSSRWHAAVKVNGKTIYKFSFATAEEAAVHAAEMRRQYLPPPVTPQP